MKVSYQEGDGCLGWLVSLAAIITNCAHSALAVCYTVTMSVALLVTYVLPYGRYQIHITNSLTDN